MSESGLAEIPPSRQAGDLSPLPWLEVMRKQGAHHLDPARFYYLDRLSRRTDAASGEVRRILNGKLQAALADYEQRFQHALTAASDELANLSTQYPDLARELQRLFAAGDYGGMRRLHTQSLATQLCVPLAQLNQHLEQVKQEGMDHLFESERGRPLLSDLATSSDMASVRRFRESWSRIAAEDEVAQSVGRGPANAGPLNSHMLMLRSLSLMGKLSPDYLRRFMSHMDTLLWLDQANQKLRAKPVRKNQSRK